MSPASLARAAWLVVAALSFLVGTAPGLMAQDSTAASRGAADSLPPPADSTHVAAGRAALDSTVRRKAPISPGGALIQSLLVPGLGQIWLGRKLTAGVFVAIEATTLTLALRANRQARQLELTDPTAAADKRQQREDFLVLLALNHVAAGIEAYVASQLYDFPGDLKLTPVHRGMRAELSVPFRLR
jgi:hypothetical protein